VWYRAAADLVLVVHFAFIVFVALGGLIVLRWWRVSWVHVPVALYGVAVELIGFICPLTPLEVGLRQRGGEAGYAGGFVEHYLTAALYPGGLTRHVQYALGGAVLVLNALIYVAVWRRRARPEVRVRRAG
jgi:hypothetical protein